MCVTFHSFIHIEQVLEAVASVTAELLVSGPASDIYPGQRKNIIAFFAQRAGVTPAEVS